MKLILHVTLIQSFYLYLECVFMLFFFQNVILDICITYFSICTYQQLLHHPVAGNIGFQFSLLWIRYYWTCMYISLWLPFWLVFLIDSWSGTSGLEHLIFFYRLLLYIIKLFSERFWRVVIRFFLTLYNFCFKNMFAFSFAISSVTWEFTECSWQDITVIRENLLYWLAIAPHF